MYGRVVFFLCLFVNSLAFLNLPHGGTNFFFPSRILLHLQHIAVCWSISASIWRYIQFNCVPYTTTPLVILIPSRNGYRPLATQKTPWTAACGKEFEYNIGLWVCGCFRFVRRFPGNAFLRPQTGVRFFVYNCFRPVTSGGHSMGLRY